MVITIDPTHVKFAIEVARLVLLVGGLALLLAARRWRPWWTPRAAPVLLVAMYLVGLVPAAVEHSIGVSIAKAETGKKAKK